MRKAATNTVAFWPMQGRPSFQRHRAFIPAFQNWKMLIKKFFIVQLPILVWCKTKDAAKDLCATGNYEPNSQIQYEMAQESLRGCHRMGDGRNFLKTSVPLYFINTYQMSLILARSILLDGAFTLFLRWKFCYLLDLSKWKPCIPELVVGMTPSK